MSATDPRDLLFGYLDWYHETLFRKLDGLSDQQLRTPIQPFGWAPLGLVKHLTWVQRRWFRWGFTAENVRAYLCDDDSAEWRIEDGESTTDVFAGYRAEREHGLRIVAGHGLDDQARVGGRFATAQQAPSLGRILFHLLQEYARHLGHLDMLRELINGVTGE